jgi:multidrug efflux pump
MLAFVLGAVLLAAKYESWRLPLAVILVVPLCLLAAVTGMTIARLPVDIFVQICFLVLVALACKNAILIVEHANEELQQGRQLHEATRAAARIRFRPIIMTSVAFIGGVFPLVVATGAGAEMRRSLGTAVFSGMIGVALFGILSSV